MNDTAKAFIQIGNYGIMTPKGEIVPCRGYAHASTIISCLSGDKEFSDWYAGKNEEVEDVEEGCRQLAENGDHPEWHVAESARDSLSWKVVQRGYERGFVRLTIYRDDLVAEAKWNRFQVNQPVVRDFAKELGFQLGRLINVKFETVS